MTAKKRKQKMFTFLRKKVGHRAACEIKKAFNRLNQELPLDFYFQEYLEGLMFYSRGNKMLIAAFIEGLDKAKVNYSYEFFTSLAEENEGRILLKNTKHFYDSRDDYDEYIVLKKRG